MSQQSLDAPTKPEDGAPFLTVLGIAQDAGYPQAGCRKACCAQAWTDPNRRRHVVCLAIVDPVSHERWLFECTPDFREQLRQLNLISPPIGNSEVDGIFLTHAHIGHYTGLIHLGREVIGASQVPVYAMPRMKQFLERNGPWSQLVTLENIMIRQLSNERPQRLNERISVTPFLVPHRDEYSETVGYRIQGPHRSAIFLPDIDKWDRWETRIEDVLSGVDAAYLDGTFLGGRVADCAALEMLCTGNGTGGSNPPLSAYPKPSPVSGGGLLFCPAASVTLDVHRRFRAAGQQNGFCRSEHRPGTGGGCRIAELAVQHIEKRDRRLGVRLVRRERFNPVAARDPNPPVPDHQVRFGTMNLQIFCLMVSVADEVQRNRDVILRRHGGCRDDRNGTAAPVAAGSDGGRHQAGDIEQRIQFVAAGVPRGNRPD